MIDTFNINEFSAVLPDSAVPLGLVLGEYCFLLPVTSKAGIFIRSSIDHTNLSGALGQDSIRIYPVACQKIPTIIGDKWAYQFQGSSDTRWVTRQKGWEARLQESIKKLFRMIWDAGECTVCGKPLKILKVKKEGLNKGRWFASCDYAHKQFMWLAEEEEKFKL